MSKWKKVAIALKVFLPIIIKSIIDLWNELMDAYDQNNLNKLADIAQQVNDIAENGGKNV